MKANKRQVKDRLGPLAATGALVAGAIGVLGMTAGPASAATTPDCSGQLSGSNNLCVDGSGGTLTVTPSGTLGAAPMVVHGVANSFLGTLSSNGSTSFPAGGTNWIGGLSGTLAGITAQITISNDGTATGTANVSTDQVSVSLAGNLTIHLVSSPGPCTYTQPFSVSGTLSALTQSGSVYKATGSVTQPSVAIAINNGSATGGGCGIEKSVLTGATQTLTLPITVYTTLSPSSISTPPANNGGGSSSSGTGASTGTGTGTGTTGASGATSTVPSANTGEPWSGWIWWAAVAAIGMAGLGLMLGVVRRRGVHQRA